MWHKRLRWLLCLSFFLVTSLIGAHTVQIGFLSLASDDITPTFTQQLFTSISDYVTEIPSSPHYLERIRKRVEKNEELVRLDKIHTSIKKSDGVVPHIETTPSMVLDDTTDTLAVSWKQISLPPALRQATLSGDPIVIDYLMDLDKLDGLMLCTIDRFDVFYRVRIIFYNPHRTVLYDGITKPEELAHLKKEVFLATISALTDQELALLVLTTPLAGTSLSIDEQLAPMYENFIPILEGSHLVSMSALGYLEETKSITVESGEILSLELSLQRMEGPPLLVTSSAHDPLVTLGHGPSGSTPLIWQAQENPFVLYAYQEGMRPSVRQFTKPIEQIELVLQPPWMDGVQMIARSQKHVYASLGRTLLFGATAIIVDSLARSFSSNNLWQPMVWGALGAMTLSSLETGVQLFAYYQKTKYSSH